MSRQWTWIMVALALGGCITSGGTDGEGAGGDVANKEDLDVAWPLTYTTSGCVENVAFLLVDMDHLTAQLPDGYDPRPATDLLEDLGIAAGTDGRGAVLMNGFECGEASTDLGGLTAGEVAVLVEHPPAAEAHGLPEADYAFYQFTAFTEGPGHAAALRAAGMTVVEAALDVGLSVGAASAAGLSVAVDGAPWFDATFQTGPPEPLPGHVTFWEETPNGSARVELTMENRAARGVVTSCTIAEGTILHAITGMTTCGPGDAVAVAFLNQEWEGGVHGAGSSTS